MIPLFAVIIVGVSQLTSEEKITKNIVFGIIPLGKNVQENFVHTFEYIEESTGVKVKEFNVNNYAELVSALKNNEVDIALLGGHSYVTAKLDGVPLEAFATGIRADTASSTYHSIIISHKDNNIDSIEDIKSKSNEQVLAVVDLLSTSGYLMPMEKLLDEDINPKYDFQNVIVAGGHDRVVIAVKEQRASIGATSDIEYHKMINEGIIDPDEIVVVWESEKIQGLPFVLRENLDEQTKEEIKSAFYEMGADLSSEEFLGGWGDIISYVPVDDEDYQYVFRATQTVNSLE